MVFGFVSITPFVLNLLPYFKMANDVVFLLVSVYFRVEFTC